MNAKHQAVAGIIREHREYAEFDDPNSGPACSCGWQWDGTPFSDHLTNALVRELADGGWQIVSSPSKSVLP